MLGFRLSFTRLTLPFLLRTESTDLLSFAVISTNGGHGRKEFEPRLSKTFASNSFDLVDISYENIKSELVEKAK